MIRRLGAKNVTFLYNYVVLLLFSVSVFYLNKFDNLVHVILPHQKLTDMLNENGIFSVLPKKVSEFDVPMQRNNVWLNIHLV